MEFSRLASVAGLLHDYGKYTDCFQKMLATGRGACQHAIHGALLSYLGTGDRPLKPVYPQVALAIAGHHSGIPDYTGSGKSLAEKVKDERYRSEADHLFQRAAADSLKLGRALAELSTPATITQTQTKVEPDLYTRMLFSCLVDADRLDSAGRSPLELPLNAKERLGILMRHLENLQGLAADGAVKEMRRHVLQDCLDAAGGAGNLFSLSVPTGGGKTLSAMAFALQRAALQPERFRRVIVVIPYLSIIEQNAKVYAEIFGAEALLEHHSGSLMKLKPQGDSSHEVFVPDDKADEEERYQRTGVRVETENWDAPLIVTTSVRFFESLFSNRPKDLRRVHNIARSIVVLDEVQTLPRRLLAPLLGMMKELADDWNTNFVFSTATQPAFERATSRKDPRWEPGTLREIVREPEALRAKLRRVELRWEIREPVGWPGVAERALDASQCLAIVNLRDHARELFNQVLRLAQDRGMDCEGIFHLSTRMCAAHRLRVLDKIRNRLKSGATCHVISTQLVEAGVDVDFPLVLRALAPLDSIVQAAGRADREGRRTAEAGHPAGVVVVFRPEDHRMPPNEYAEATAITESIVEQARLDGKCVQVDSAEEMAAYFERYYGVSDERVLGSGLEALRLNLKFATLADQFEMINNRTKDVFVSDDDEARTAIAEFRNNYQLTPELRRTLQRHTVGLNPSEFKKAYGVLEEFPVGSEIWIASDYAYDERLGLSFEPGPEHLVL
jgi:CRISPR-associated endonuclease/helicase Cas3